MNPNIEPKATSTRIDGAAIETGNRGLQTSRRKQALIATAAVALVVAAILAARPALGRRDPPASRNASPTAGNSRRVSLAAPFDLKNSIVPAKEILSGGPGKDGIPALTLPKTVAGQDADYLRPTDRVVGVVIKDEARAYPLRIMTWHEIANDRLGGLPIAVTFCPLCDSVAVFDRRSSEGVREYGVSGMLYNSNVMLYDRGADRESLFSQIMAQGVSGPRAKEKLRALPVELTDWGTWRARYPESTTLSTETEHPRDYERDPYLGYLDRPGLMFPARPSSDRLPAKAPVLGLWSDRSSRAYSMASLAKGASPRREELDGKRFTLEYDGRTRTARVTEAEAGLSWMYSLWFAWYAMRPDTQLADNP